MNGVTMEQYVRASYPLIIVETFDPVVTEKRLRATVETLKQVLNTEVLLDVQDILSLKGQVAKYLSDFAERGKWSILLLRNAHFFMQDKGVLQALHTIIRGCRESGKPQVIVGMCPVMDSLPPELERDGVVVRDGLPEDEEIFLHIMEIAVKYREKASPSEDTLREVAKISKGLTLAEIERAVKLSLVTKKEIDPAVIAEVKKQIIRQSAALSLYQPLPSDSMADIAGMENMKFFVRRTRGRGRGILIMGPPGTGKTQFAKALSTEFGIPLLIADVGSIFHGIVGSSEANMRRMIATVEAFGRSFLLLDEIEKAFSGLTGGGSSDGGTTQRTLSKFLTWLSDRRSLDTYVIATCNAMRLPPEYVRSGRFSSIFYLGLPGKSVREGAWEIHKSRFGVAQDDQPPNDDGWTGAEIFQCCELAHDMQVSLGEASSYVTHVTKVAKNDLDDLKRFAQETGLVPADDEEDDKDDNIPEVA